jgi:2-amino-4-hydroxy-6-hydroxymethyldihydropteridine diphosphokinase/dihydropteroate synthase
MFILGLGSNLGPPLDNFRLAIKLLSKTHSITVKKISSVYQSDALLPTNAPADWNKPYLNLAIACESKLTPDEVLREIKKIEEGIGRTSSATWSPRIIDIDILAWEQLIYKQENLQIPHAELCNRPFALWPLLDLLPNWQHPLQNISEIIKHWGSRFSGNAPFHTQQIPHRLDTPALVGVLNITPDSFSDGGQFNTPKNALAHVETLFNAGAEIIDIGAESTRPNATLITPEQEWNLLQPTLQIIQEQWREKIFKPKISIDTRHYQVAEKALQFNIDWLNDVTGFADKNICNVAADSNVKCVVMHSLSIPPSQQKVLDPTKDPCEQILNWMRERLDALLKYGIKSDQIIFDPGIGFSKTPQQSLTLLKNIEKLRALNMPLLIGHSRKSFLKPFGDTQPQERDLETALLSFYLGQHAVNYLRVHNVEFNARAMRILEKLC